MGMLKITQTKGISRCPQDQVRTIKALGLKHMQQSVIHEDNPSIRGMVFQVKHLVQVEEISPSQEIR